MMIDEPLFGHYNGNSVERLFCRQREAEQLRGERKHELVKNTDSGVSPNRLVIGGRDGVCQSCQLNEHAVFVFILIQ